MIGRVAGKPFSEGRALAVVPSASAKAEDVRVTPCKEAFGFRLDRNAGFLTQLLAARDGLAQTRARRRAEPHEAIAAYRAMPTRLRHHDGELLAVV
jgi:hypothetical protein